MGSVEKLARYFSLDGKVVLLTGATGGIGLEMAEAFASAAATLVVTGDAAEPCNALVSRLQTAGVEAWGEACDVRDRDALETMARGERFDVVASHDGAIIVDELGKNTDRRQLGYRAQINAGFRVAGSHENSTRVGDEWKNVARADKVAGLARPLFPSGARKPE